MSSSESQLDAASGQSIPRAADLFDPQAFAVRLDEARRRRARVLARGARMETPGAAASRQVSRPVSPRGLRPVSPWVGAGLASGLGLTGVVCALFLLAAPRGPAPAVDTAPLTAAHLPDAPASRPDLPLPAGAALQGPPLPGLARFAADAPPPLDAMLGVRPRARPGDLPQLTRALHAAPPPIPRPADPVGRAVKRVLGRILAAVRPVSPAAVPNR